MFPRTRAFWYRYCIISRSQKKDFYSFTALFCKYFLALEDKLKPNSYRTIINVFVDEVSLLLVGLVLGCFSLSRSFKMGNYFALYMIQVLCIFFVLSV